MAMLFARPFLDPCLVARYSGPPVAGGLQGYQGNLIADLFTDVRLKLGDSGSRGCNRISADRRVGEIKAALGYEYGPEACGDLLLLHVVVLCVCDCENRKPRTLPGLVVVEGCCYLCRPF